MHDGTSAVPTAPLPAGARRRVLRPEDQPLRRRRPSTPSRPPSRMLAEPRKPATNRLAGPLVELHRRADLADGAGLHHGDAVADRVGLFLVVGDEDGREAEPLLQRAQVAAHARPASWRRGWTSGSSSSSTLGSMAMVRATATRCCWPPRKLRRPAVGVGGEADQLQRLGDAGGRSRRAAGGVPRGRRRRSAPPSCAATARSSGTPCRRRASTAAGRATSRPSSSTWPRLRLGEARDQPQQGGLAAARGAEEGEELAGADREVDVLQDVRRARRTG